MRHIGALQRQRRRNHVVGELRSGRHAVIDDDEQLEIIERTQRELVIGECHRRVATADDQRPDPAIAGGQDLLRQRRRRHLAAVSAKIADPRRRPLRRLARRCDLGAMRRFRIEEKAVLHQVTLAIHPAENRVEHHDEVLGQAGVSGHVGAGTGTGRASRAGGEHPGCGDDVRCIQLAPLGHEVEREPVDGSMQFTQLAHPPFAELVILQPLLQHHADHPGHQRCILAGPDLQMDVGEARKFGAARVDHDQLHPFRPTAAHHHERVGALQAPDRRIGRHHRVVTDGHVDVGVGEVLIPSLPATQPEPGEALRGLIDGDRGVERRRTQPVVERTRGRHSHRVLVPTRTGVGRHRARSIGVDDAAQRCRDLVERRRAGDLFERAVGSAAQRRTQPVGVGHLVGKLTTLDACVTLEEWIVHHTTYRQDAVVLHIHLHRTTCMAYPAERRRGLHFSLLGVSVRL